MIAKPLNPYSPKVEKFTNSSEFSYLAESFNKNDVYTTLPNGTIEYKNFWLEVKDRCENGFTNSKGIRITGHHFYYLNFCRISGFDEIANRKIEMFPRFMDLDYEYFHMIEYCELNEKSLVAVKGRRQGWSYKAAAICSREFLFYPSSSSIIGTFLSSFGLETMKMARENLDWVNANTEFRKQRNPDVKEFVMARYQAEIEGVKVWKGYKSTIRAISFKDNPSAAVGKSASKLILDEAGVFPNITDTYGYTEPLIKAGSRYSGMAIIFGSSGDMDSGSKYFYEMFTNPSKYNMLEFEDPENPAKKIGFFSTALMGHEGFCKDPNSPYFKDDLIDIDGNSNLDATYDHLMWTREAAKGGLDPKALHSAVTQFPVTWQEAFLRNKGAIFASPELLEWLAEVETSKSIRDQVETGKLIWRDSKLEFQPSDEVNYITSFPLKPEEDQRGAIAIWEKPDCDGGDIPPYGLYIAGSDPYDMDKSESGSLGSFFVYKRFFKMGKTHDIVVAEFTGRPKYANDFYESCRRLCIYYNAKVLYENQLKGMKNYFFEKNSLHFMWEQPDYMIKDMIKDSKVQRGYGIHMTRGSNGNSGIKDMCELYLKDWLYTEKANEDDTILFNFHTIKSIGLLKELIAYDGEVNTDRVIALMLCILQTKELHKIHVHTTTDENNLWGADPFLKKIWESEKINSNKFKRLKF